MPEPYGMTAGNALQEPTPVHRHRLESASGLAIELLDLGATLHRIEIPDGAGGTVPLSLSLDSVAEREDPERNPYLGVTIGRYANRLRESRALIDGDTFVVHPNEGANQIHGGPLGFSEVVWEMSTASDDTVVFRRVSPDGEMGFPGRLDVTVAYTLDDRTIRITHEATTDAPTVVSMTNHTYWNLGGPTTADIGDHTVQLDSSRVVPVDDESLPSGEPTPVADTPCDLRRTTLLSDRLGFALPRGFDHCFMVDGSGFRRHARVSHEPTGRTLEIWSDQPASQFYTGAFLGGGPGADGRFHDPFSALCVEPQHVPDAPNLAWAPSPVLRPGERYVHRLEFRLDWNRPTPPDEPDRP